MFMASAANDTFQGKAIQSINDKWADGEQTRAWTGRATIGHQVCKKKFNPFHFEIETVDEDDRDSDSRKKKIVRVTRMFGCPHHSNLRKEKIECYGVRKGWEPFGQWSMQKAQQLARRETIRLNSKNDCARDSIDNIPISCGSQGGKKGLIALPLTSESAISNTEREEVKTICHNGNCAWKRKDKYDNVYNEIKGYDWSSDEET